MNAYLIFKILIAGIIIYMMVTWPTSSRLEEQYSKMSQEEILNDLSKTARFLKWRDIRMKFVFLVIILLAIYKIFFHN